MKISRIIFIILILCISITSSIYADKFTETKKVKVFKIKSIDICDPKSNFDKVIGWDTILPAKGSENYIIKVKIKIDPPAEAINELNFPIRLSIYSPVSMIIEKDLNINVENAVLSSDKSEIWLTIREDELGDTIKHIQQNNDGLSEYCSFEANSSTNFNDSNRFDSLCASKGMLNRISARCDGNDSSTAIISSKGTIHAYTPKADLNYFIAAGSVYLKVSIGEKSVIRLIKSQSDWFYASAHGSSIYGYVILGNGFINPEDVYNLWHDIERVYFSLCSVLHIAVEEGDTNPSHGLQWARTGAKYYLGYRKTAPPDKYYWMDEYTADILSKSFEYELSPYNMSPPLAWLNANKDAYTWYTFVGKENVYNACAIRVDSPTSLSYWYWYKNDNGKYEIRLRKMSFLYDNLHKR